MSSDATFAPPVVSVVIPAFNEADRIAATVTAARGLPRVARVVVVDDGSTDDTQKAAQKAGAHVVRTPRNGGKARAMETGADEAIRLSEESRQNETVFLFLDADLGDTAREASVLITPVLNGEADMTIATFPVIPGRGGGSGVVVRASRWGIRRATNRIMQAPLSGQRCLTAQAFSVARPLASGFGVETALTIAVLRAGLRVAEIPTQMDHRVTDNSWKARRHRARQLRDVLRALLGAR